MNCQCAQNKGGPRPLVLKWHARRVEGSQRGRGVKPWSSKKRRKLNGGSKQPAGMTVWCVGGSAMGGWVTNGGAGGRGASAWLLRWVQCVLLVQAVCAGCGWMHWLYPTPTTRNAHNDKALGITPRQPRYCCLHDRCAHSCHSARRPPRRPRHPVPPAVTY